MADSAGVRIVQHGLDAEPAAVLRLAPEPDFRVGWDPAGPTFVWVGALSLDYRTTEHFDVFSPTGAWLASVSLPPRVQVLDIRQGRILATQYNDLGVNAVTVFRMEGW